MRRNTSTFDVAWVGICLYLVFALSVVGGLLYAAFHFISKFW